MLKRSNKKMVIAKRFDHRKRKKREIFFGLPVLPLLVFLALLIILLILPPASVVHPLIEKTNPISDFSNIPITGEVVGGLNVTKTQYAPGKSLEGDFVVRFYPSDLIPWNATANFSITSIKCKHYYVCSFGDKIPWEKYNKTLGRCVNVSNYANGPWGECLESYNIYSCEGNVTCCAPGMGQGNYYANLNCTGGKECWDKCASMTEKKLIDLIALSDTPHNGNYTSGDYYNANASGSSGQLSGSGIGFGYCYPGGGQQQRYGYYPGGQVTGYAAQQPPPQQPDLIVDLIMIRESGVQPPGQPTGAAVSEPGTADGINLKVYAYIKNVGQTMAGPFTIRACWNQLPVPPYGPIYTPYVVYSEPIPSNCKEVNVDSLAAGATYIMDVNSLDNLRDYELKVTADYYNSVVENNENNNEKTVYLGCLDFDDGNNTLLRARCADFIDSAHYDYCDNTQRSLLYEYTCEPEIGGYIGESCYPNSVTCQESCEDGRCVGGIQPACQDTDNDTINNPNPFVRGVCSVPRGMLPVMIPDQCKENSPNILIEQDCNAQDQCQGTEIDCSQYGMVCFEGICALPPKPDLIVEKIERSSDFKKARVTIKNIGNGNVTAPFSLLINISEGVNAVEVVPISSPLAPGQSYFKDSQTNIEGKSVWVNATVDFYNNITEENEGNNNRIVRLLPYTCDNWVTPNIYHIDLDDSLNLKAPNVEGIYLFNVSFNYGNVNLSKSSVMLTVVQPQTKKACRNNECTNVECYPPNCNDTCSSNSDCRQAGGCYENWQFTTWTECVNGKKQRECYDALHCGTIEVKPLTCLQVGNKFIETQDCCVQAWQCDEWSACYEYQGALIQSRTCNDLNRCNPLNLSSAVYRDCCSEDWSCTWSPCINGLETLTCQELNGCNTNFTKPQEHSRGCKVTAKAAVPWWIVMIIIIAIVIVTVVVLFATNVIKLPKKGGVVKEEAVETTGRGAGMAEAYPELKAYIKNAIAAGISKDEIRRKLVEAGWPEDSVNAELSKI